MKKTRILTIAVASIFLLATIVGCKQKSLNSENAETSKSATVEELGQMNR